MQQQQEESFVENEQIENMNESLRECKSRQELKEKNIPFANL